MKNGIYHVTFSAGNQQAGAGIIVLSNNVVNGGDTGFIFTGTLLRNANERDVSAEIEVSQWAPGHQSIFGSITQFKLMLAGQVDPAANAFRLAGHIQGQPGLRIAINGRLLSVGTGLE